VILPCIEAKRFEEKHAFPQMAIATGGCNVVGRHNFLAQKLEAKNVSLVSVHCRMRTASLRPVTILPQICTIWCTKLRKHFNAIMEVLYCFTVVAGTF